MNVIIYKKMLDFKIGETLMSIDTKGNQQLGTQQNKKDCSATFEHDIEMMKFFQQEFMFRHNHYWNILIKFFLMTVVVTVLPITSDIFGVSLKTAPTDSRYLLFFPALGLIIAILSLVLLLAEAKRMTAVNRAKYRINGENMDKKYQYININGKMHMPKRWLVGKIAWVFFGVEVLIVFATAIFIIAMNKA